MNRSEKKPIHMPKGFLASGIHCGAKRKRKDLALLYSQQDCVAAAVFTRNTVKAAPLIRGIGQIKSGYPIRAVVVNSGNANCMTGKRGLQDVEKMAFAASSLLGIREREVFISSTGIIGQYMVMKPIISGMKALVDKMSDEGIRDAADGIMTTDGFRKISHREFKIRGKKVSITGIAKGAGMIKPEMATTLAYVMTDARIHGKALRKALAASTEVSFNSITVDGDMSTNDTVLVLANGMAGNTEIKMDSRELRVFSKHFDEVMLELASMIVRDGEGAGKFIEVRVKGARTDAEAKKAACTIADSLLVKCAVSGEDPNWGRVASSAGASGIRFDPQKMSIKLDGVTFFRKGRPVEVKGTENSSVFKQRDVIIEVDLGAGTGSSIFYSCDITTKYISLNSFYTT